MFVARDGCRKELVVARNWWSQGIGGRKELPKGIGSRKNWLSHELVVSRDGCRTRWLSYAMVVARNWLSRGIGVREELVVSSNVVARNWFSHGIGFRTEFVVARNLLSHGLGCRTDLVVARNWLSHGIGCRREMMVALIGSRTNW